MNERAVYQLNLYLKRYKRDSDKKVFFINANKFSDWVYYLVNSGMFFYWQGTLTITIFGEQVFDTMIKNKQTFLLEKGNYCKSDLRHKYLYCPNLIRLKAKCCKDCYLTKRLNKTTEYTCQICRKTQLGHSQQKWCEDCSIRVSYFNRRKYEKEIQN